MKTWYHHTPSRSEPTPEWSAQAVHEGSVCRAVSDSTSTSKLTPALPAHAHGPTGLSSQWLSDTHQSGTQDTGAVCGQPATRLPLRSHPGGPR